MVKPQALFGPHLHKISMSNDQLACVGSVSVGYPEVRQSKRQSTSPQTESFSGPTLTCTIMLLVTHYVTHTSSALPSPMVAPIFHLKRNVAYSSQHDRNVGDRNSGNLERRCLPFGAREFSGGCDEIRCSERKN